MSVANIPTHSGAAESTGASDSTEIAAAVAGKKIRIVSLIFTSSAAATLTLKDEDDAELIKFLNTTSIVLGAGDLQMLTLAAGKALEYDTSTGNSEIYVEYRLVD